jgi:hypothetical protein
MQRMKKYFLLIQSKLARRIFCGLIGVILLSISGCGGSNASMYNSDYPLTNELVKSRTSKLSAKIPTGWFAADDNECNCIDLWLIKNDYSATLSFISLNIDSTAVKEEASKSELEKVLSISKTFKKAKYGSSLKTFSNEEFFANEKNQFAAYEYMDSQNRLTRVVLFRYNNKYYELTAVPVKDQPSQELYKIQNAVLSSIK